jgi:putative toxin-antitoxin system antitoxin component (TIGR02293 family)
MSYIWSVKNNHMGNIVEEPAVAYEISSPFIRILRNPRSESYQNDQELISLTRNGIEKSSFKYLADYLGISQELLSQFLHTSLRNLQRKDDHELLDTLKSERMVELAAFSQRAIQVLGNQTALQNWLNSPLMALDSKKPTDFLDTTFGINYLYKILGRIEQGIYS